MTDGDVTRSLQIDPDIGAVEVKITARAKDEELVESALKLAEIESERRKIFFFDTHDLTLFDAGIVLRARVRDGDDDSTVKLRPVDPTQISIDWKKTEGFEIELDTVGDAAICSAKLTAAQKGHEIEEAAAGKRPLRKLFSQAQERLVVEHAPASVDWETLTVLGPVDVHKWEIEPKGFPYEVTIEQWVLPDGSDLVELSTKAEPQEAAEATEQFLALLRRHGVDTEGDQQTKTRAALRFFTTGVGID